MSGATFDVELIDKVTSAARSITGSTESVLQAFGRLIEPAVQGRNAMGQFTEKIGPLDGAAKALAPILDVVGEGVSKLVDTAMKAAEAVAVLTVAVAGLVVGMAAMAIKAGEAQQKMMSTFATLAGGKAQGAAVLAVVDKLGAAFGMTREELTPWANKLLAAGVSADKLEASLKAVAAANALLEGGGEKVTAVLAKLTESGMAGSKIKFSTSMLVGTGVSEAELMKALGMTPKMLELAKKQGKLTGQQIADAIVKVLGEKGAGPLAEQTNRITNIWTKFKEDVTKLFEGVTESVGYKSFIKGLKDLFGIFQATSPAAKAMHAGIVGAFNAIFASAAKVLPYIKKGIELAIIAVLKAVIAFKAWRKEGTQLGAMSTAFKLVASEVKLAATTIYNFAAGLATILAVGARVIALGKSISDGLAKGIRAGIPGAVAAVHNLGAAVIGALKAALAIASPSKEFAKLGAFTAAGFSGGIKAGAPGVKAASAGMAASAVQGAAGKPGAPGKGAAAGAGKVFHFHFASGAIQTGGGGHESKGGGLTEADVSAIFERIALTQGLGGAGG